MKTRKSYSVLLGLFLVLALAGFGMASPALAAGNQIIVHTQDTNNGQVIVDSVTAAQDGWLLIWTDANGVPGSVLGFAPVHQGTNTSIVMDIRTAYRNGNDDITPTLWAMLVADPNVLTPFAVPDHSITPADGVTLVGFSSTLAGGMAH